MPVLSKHPVPQCFPTFVNGAKSCAVSALYSPCTDWVTRQSPRVVAYPFLQNIAHSGSILPGLPDDVAKYCIALVPRSRLPILSAVCKRWRLFVRSKEFLIVRKEAGRVEEWLYILTVDPEGKGVYWEVLDNSGEQQMLSQMPGLKKAAFGVVTFAGSLLIIGGYVCAEGTRAASPEVIQYDSRLNRWSMLANMNIARYDFACAEVEGKVYVVGGLNSMGQSLSSVEVYDPDMNEWSLIKSIYKPRWGCFACSFGSKLYVMGGRSAFTIGNSKYIDIYDSHDHRWHESKNGCVMVTSHMVLGKRLFCIEWKNQRKLAIFTPKDNSWRVVPLPLTGSSKVGFQFGILDGKLLLFSSEFESDYQTLLYDPNVAPGMEWGTSKLKPSGVCLCTVTISI